MRALRIDRQLLVTILALLVFGLLVLYSAGQTDVPSSGTGVWRRQLFWLVIGTVAAAMAFRLSPRILEWLAPMAYILALVLLVLVLIIGTGAGTASASKSWLQIAGIRIGQPAEFAKLAVILMMARYLSGLRNAPDSISRLMVPCAIAGLPAFLVLLQPDLGSAIVFAGILFGMLYWAGVNPWWLFLLASPVASLLLAFSTTFWTVWMVALALIVILLRPWVVEGAAIYLTNMAMGAIAIPIWQRLAPYQQNRLLIFLNPEVDPQGAGYQSIQSKVTIGSGGWVGQGFLEGPQKRLAFLPEQHTDFIFPVVGEELGFVGVMVALILFMVLLLVILRIARRAMDAFASLLAFGVLSLLFTHVFENIGMTVNLMPITGIPLPFFSYGGSFMLTIFAGLGLVFRVAWESRFGGYIDT